MSDPIWNSASGIEDRVGELLAMVDQMELDPGQADFHRMRALLSDIGDGAIFIASQVKDRRPGAVLEYIINGAPGTTEPAASLSSRQYIEER